MTQFLGTVGRPDLGETASLLVSEVVTNAVLHAGTPVDLSLSYDSQGLHVRVADGSIHMPTRRRYGATAGTGRGLLMLEELVDDWGVTAQITGKTVWFRLSSVDPALVTRTTSSGPRHDTGNGSSGASDPAALQVELHNMPLLLHAAWREYIETLLREYLLATIEEHHVDDAIQMHARATAAIAVLEEHIPRADVAIQPEQLMKDATEPLVSADVVRLPMPRAAVEDFEVLDRVVDAALRLADEGRLMTPPSQPEIRSFRRWVCAQVLDQAAGAPPVAWSMDREQFTQPELHLRWNPDKVNLASNGCIGADEANRIVAISPAALEILGYDAPADILGRRIVAIIPERFRQAHVAGFMMFLNTGRRPLIGVPVEVPALRRDGSEVMVELSVNVEPAGDGRMVFVADLKLI